MIHPKRWSRLVNTCLIAVSAACAGGDKSVATEDARPQGIELASIVPASAAAGAVVPVTPRFTVKDQYGHPMAGVPVTLTTSGGGALSNPPVRTSDENATSVGLWTLGTTVRLNSVTISVEGLTPLVITIQAAAGPAATIALVTGNAQSAYAGRAIGSRLVFAVRDRYQNAVAGAPVAFAVTGGGTLGESTVTSDSEGTVTAPIWKLGLSATTQQIRASIGPVVATADARVRTDFDISVRFFGPAMTAEQQMLFSAAAARISAMVTGDLPAVQADGLDLATFCENPGLPTISEIIDDVVIYASIATIDGPGKVLAQAGPCAVRSGGTQLPIIGVMEFDAADLATLAGSGSLQDVITHEMMHVLGIGTVWSSTYLLSGYNTASVTYSGMLGREGCIAHGGASICPDGVPVENTGGPGTANGHWRESVFGNELMTGYANAGGMPISRMTVGAFGDLGYAVNYDAAAAYRIPGTGSASVASLSVTRPTTTAGAWERVLTPRIFISPGGKVGERQ